MATEAQPTAPGTFDGELSPEGQWLWEGTGTPNDKWILNPNYVAPEPAPLTAPAPGTAILATATIDSLFTLCFGNRSADLAATPTYSWGTGNQIIAQWPGVVTPQNTGNNSAMFATFICRAMAPSTITQ